MVMWANEQFASLLCPQHHHPFWPTPKPEETQFFGDVQNLFSKLYCGSPHPRKFSGPWSEGWGQAGLFNQQTLSGGPDCYIETLHPRPGKTVSLVQNQLFWTVHWHSHEIIPQPGPLLPEMLTNIFRSLELCRSGDRPVPLGSRWWKREGSIMPVITLRDS